MKQLFIISFLCTLSGCAATSGQADGDRERSYIRSSDCISEGTIRDYKVLNDSNLIVTGSGRKTYHLELGRRATGLRSSWQIGFTSPSSWICAGLSELVVDDNFGPERIRIVRIRQLSNEDYEDLLLSFGKGGKPKPPEPQPVEGAEVEELD